MLTMLLLVGVACYSLFVFIFRAKYNVFSFFNDIKTALLLMGMNRDR
jgi:hypothetical protein